MKKVGVDHSFKSTTDHGRPAFDAFLAIWNRKGTKNCSIAAPTLAELCVHWKKITGLRLYRKGAQRVRIIQVPR